MPKTIDLVQAFNRSNWQVTGEETILVVVGDEPVVQVSPGFFEMWKQTFDGN